MNCSPEGPLIDTYDLIHLKLMFGSLAENKVRLATIVFTNATIANFLKGLLFSFLFQSPSHCLLPFPYPKKTDFVEM